MLKSITLENYKCFKDRTTIDIAPLTVLCGVNSSGKSSVLKSLLMMKQSFENSYSDGEITYNGNYVNNGNFETITNNINENFVIETSFEISTGITERNIYRDLYRQLFGINLKNNYFKNKSDNDYFLVYMSVEVTDCYIKRYSIEIFHKDLRNPIKIKLIKHRDNVYNMEVVNIPFDGGVIRTKINNCYCFFDGIKIVSIYTSNPPIDIDVSIIFNCIYTIFKNVSLQFKNNIEHIAPVRFNPQRYYISNGIYNSVGNNGENFVQILSKLSNDDFYNILPPDNNGLTSTFKLQKLQVAVTNWLKYLDVGNYNIPELQSDILQFMVDNHNIADIGFGVSQILPITVQGLIMKPNQTLLLEQPEIHLHPKAQMKMADFLLSMAYSGKTMIVETHSDHIINRIVRRVMEKHGTENSLSEIIRIYFVYKDKNNCSQIYKDIQIDPHKGLINCPPEFFDQYGDELRFIMKQGYENYKNNQG